MSEYGKWTLVRPGMKEKPPENVPVLIRTNRGMTVAKQVLDGTVDRYHVIGVGGGTAPLQIINQKQVTHWMPLPEEPEW